jgi:hypothetical protein
MSHIARTTVLLLGLAGFALATPFVNGGFESPGGPSTIFLALGDTTVPGWIHGGNSQGEFYTVTGAFSIGAFEGTHYIGWGANGATGGTLSQTFDTLIGAAYNVDYYLTTQQLGGIPPIEIALVEALDGSVVLNSTVNSFNPAAGVWISGNTLTFVATSTSTILRFTDQTSSANSVPVNWGLDLVTVNGVSGGGVPEPAPVALIGLGLGVLAFGCKTRRSC